MFMYPAGMQMVIYKQQEKDLLKEIARYSSAKTESHSSVSLVSGIVQFLNSRLFHTHPASRIVAMSFCEPRSCRLQLSS